MRFYLDYNATTPIHPEAIKAMRPYLEENFGNPSSIHSFGRATRSAIDDAREKLAQQIGAQSKEIIFTSGGTESNNLAIFGVAHARRDQGRHVITCATEHHAVLHPCQRLETAGYQIRYLPVDHQGLMDLDLLARSISSKTILVSIMSANNETGVCHPIQKIGELCRERGVLFHCDAIQSFGKEEVHVEKWKTDLLSITAHKFYGPKGIGFLYDRTGVMIQPVQLGGAHENERRAGTENVAGIVGMAAAAEMTTQQAKQENRRLFDLTEQLWKELEAKIPEIHRHGHPVQRIGNTLNVSFANCDGEALLMGLDLEGIAISSGSACMVGSMQPSHVLEAMGVDEKLIRSTVRFSLGNDSKKEVIPEIVERVVRVVKRLRKTTDS